VPSTGFGEAETGRHRCVSLAAGFSPRRLFGSSRNRPWHTAGDPKTPRSRRQGGGATLVAVHPLSLEPQLRDLLRWAKTSRDLEVGTQEAETRTASGEFTHGREHERLSNSGDTEESFCRPELRYCSMPGALTVSWVAVLIKMSASCALQPQVRDACSPCLGLSFLFLRCPSPWLHQQLGTVLYFLFVCFEGVVK
jgi:hypothetical protein